MNSSTRINVESVRRCLHKVSMESGSFQSLEIGLAPRLLSEQSSYPKRKGKTKKMLEALAFDVGEDRKFLGKADCFWRRIRKER